MADMLKVYEQLKLFNNQLSDESVDNIKDTVLKLREDILTLTGNKVDIMADDNTYKNTYAILQEISKVWDSMTKVDQDDLRKLIDGTTSNFIRDFIEKQKTN